eukprot:441614_1
MTQNMEHANVSYGVADCLSVFYGLSNSIISILDSISDFVFIVFLMYSAHTQQEHHTINILLFFTIGNMISVASIIAANMCYEGNIKSYSMRAAATFILFFLLSPLLPSLEWILKRIQDTAKLSYLVIQPNQDGILLWFQQEITRNKIFIAECVLESCFQLIVQFL